MSDGKDKGSFWTSIPGILTGLTALISALATIYFGIQPPQILFFDANPSSIMINDSAVLRWNVTNAQSVFIDGGVGFKSNSGSCRVSPKKTTSYNITAKNFWHMRDSNVSIEVRPEEPPEVRPEAIFSHYPPNPKAGQTIQFDGSKSKGQNYLWDFGDGKNKESGEKVSHKYSKGGTYLVNLTVTTDQGENSSSKEVEVIEPLVASFNCSPTNPEVDEEVAFNASQSRGDITDYEWDFDEGDDRRERGPIINHSFSKSGPHEVELTVRNDRDEEDSFSIDVNVELKRTDYSIGIDTGKGWHYSPGNPTDGGGTSQEVRLTLHGEDGEVNTGPLSPIIQDETRVFPLPNEIDVGDISRITIHFTERKTDAWKPEWITVRNNENGRSWSFYINTWLDKTGSFGPYNPSIIN